MYVSLDVQGWQAFAPTLSFTIRLAQNMGMAQLGEEVRGEVPKAGIFDREVSELLCA